MPEQIEFSCFRNPIFSFHESPNSSVYGLLIFFFFRYFLFEYEQALKAKGKQSTSKLNWNEFTSRLKDHVTLEHIYPQTDTDPYWVSKFGHLNTQQRILLAHSLGNLLPLSRKKNSSLQNDAFTLKKNNGVGVGYYNGSISENEVNTKVDWTPEEIRERGITLLNFMEKRWGIELGDENYKQKLLHVNFLVAKALEATA